jgi:hypothetical protein
VRRFQFAFESRIAPNKCTYSLISRNKSADPLLFGTSKLQLLGSLRGLAPGQRDERRRASREARAPSNLGRQLALNGSFSVGTKGGLEVFDGRAAIPGELPGLRVGLCRACRL